MGERVPHLFFFFNEQWKGRVRESVFSVKALPYKLMLMNMIFKMQVLESLCYRGSAAS